MGRLFQSIRDLNAEVETIRRRPYGVIEVVDGELIGIHCRPWPKLVSGMEAWWDGALGKGRHKKNHSLVYYNQPAGHRNYLALAYTVTSIHTTWKTWVRSLAVLDFVAYAKRSDALLAEVYNKRISDRLLARLGWEPQNLSSSKRHWIKRFYGNFPDHPLFKTMGLKHPIPDPKAIVAAAFGAPHLPPADSPTTTQP
ncbi:MAG: hypothetical protein AAF456_12695 [Planctomycetota bacterium]